MQLNRYLNHSCYLLGENVKEFDFSWNARAIFPVGKQSQSAKEMSQGVRWGEEQKGLEQS